MFPGMDESLKGELFATAPAEGPIWIGDIYSLNENQELIPVRFGAHDFILGFASPHFEAGDEVFLGDFTRTWADEHVPAVPSRLLKMARVDAEHNLFNPDAWQLDVPQQIFQFGRTMAEATALHAQAFPDCKAYYFWAASEQLERLYERSFRHVNRTCLPGRFRPILEPIGDFHGYQRT